MSTGVSVITIVIIIVLSLTIMSEIYDRMEVFLKKKGIKKPWDMVILAIIFYLPWFIIGFIESLLFF